jgi:hypothetical protein
MINRGGILVLGLLGGLGSSAVVAGCSSSLATDGGNDGSIDHPLAKDSGTFTCGDAACNSSEVCLVPPCSCITLGDAGPVCPAPYCVAPTPDDPVDCTPLDGGLSGTVTSADGGSRVCYHVCI